MDKGFEMFGCVLIGLMGLSHIFLNKQWANLSYKWASYWNQNTWPADNINLYRAFYYIFGILFFGLAVYLFQEIYAAAE